MPKRAQSSAKKVKKHVSPQWGVLWFIFLALTLIVSVIGRLMGWAIFQDTKHQWQLKDSSEVAGTVNFTALKPEPKDKGEVELWFRELNESKFENSGVKIPLQQDATWKWLNAYPGITYELQAVLMIDGKEVRKSEVVVATAPSLDVELPLKVTWRDLPDDVVASSSAKLGGEVVVNGYVPSGARLEVYAVAPKYYQEEVHPITSEVLRNSTKIAEVDQVTESVTWMWENAVPKQQYYVVSVLMQQNRIIGVSSEHIFADAGEIQLKQTINSVAIPSGVNLQSSVPSQQSPVLGTTSEKAAVAGTVTIEGPKDKNTSLLMLWRYPGEKEYKVINRYQYPSHSGTTWQWPDVEIGKRYEITAALQVDEKNTSVAPNSKIITAPATQVDFNINTYYVIPKTDGTPVHEACVDKSAKRSTAIIRLPKIDKAGHYWIQVGTEPGQSSVYNQKVPAIDGNDIKIRVPVDNGKQNYVKYSYATCVNCQSDQNYAPFSGDVGFTCF